MTPTGLAILDVLQPTPGFRTVAALGTTYSADLVACMVALTAQDFAAGEGDDYKRLQALRALDRLRGKVRIAVQQGRVGWSGQPRRALILLDSIVRPVRFPEKEASFHPKVWVVRQKDTEGRERWVLLVGSRNLTTSRSWDLGVAFEGTSAPAGGRGRLLPGLTDFVEHVADLIGEPDFAESFAGLGDVRWLMPEGVDDATFWFQRGRQADQLEENELLRFHRAERALLVSPFLDPTTVRLLSERLAGAQPMLVGGRQHLVQISRSRARSALEALNPHAIDLVTGDSAGETEVPDLQPEELVERGLHAKVIATVRLDRATLVIGSPNLTQRGYAGHNCEAAVMLHGRAEIVDPLWEWAARNASRFVPPKDSQVEDHGTEELERFRNEICALRLTLTDFENKDSVVTADRELPAATIAGAPAVIMVARLSTPDVAVRWKPGRGQVSLPRCSPGDRTAFLLIRVQAGELECRWVQCAAVVPPIGESRDRSAILDMLGFEGFLRYLRAIADASEEALADDPDDDTRASVGKATSASDGSGGFCLEDVARLIVREGDQSPRIQELRATVRRYRAALDAMVTTVSQRDEISRFWKTWDAVEQGLEMP
jgi:hypothetical protein